MVCSVDVPSSASSQWGVNGAGKYNETVFKALDFIIDRARANGMKERTTAMITCMHAHAANAWCRSFFLRLRLLQRDALSQKRR